MQEEVKRREFLAQMGSALGSIGLASGVELAGFGAETAAQPPRTESARAPTTNDIREYLLKNSP
jgi:hypothetical protein